MNNRDTEFSEQVVEMASKEKVTRLDPMKDVMHFELLKVAHSLIEAGQKKAYWDAVKKPKRPLGQVRFEVARQVATFAVPFAELAYAWQAQGLRGLLVALPVAALTGYLLDRQLQRAVTKKMRSDENIDKGRYRAVKWLAEQMGMSQEEVTLEVIAKMDQDYLKVKAIIDQKQAALDAAKRAAEEDDTRRRRARKARIEEVALAATGGTAAAAAMAYMDTASADDDYVAPAMDTGPLVNPASGLPMVSGGAIDVMGNPFGTDLN